MKRLAEGIAFGVVASFLSYILTAIVALPNLSRLLAKGSKSGISGVQTWSIYDTAGQPIMNVIAWVLVGAHGIQTRFSKPGLSEEVYFAFEFSPFVLIAGPISCLIAGVGMRMYRKREPIALSTSVGTIVVGYSASLVAIATYSGVTENTRHIQPVLKPAVFPPWFILTPLIAGTFGLVGIIAVSEFSDKVSEADAVDIGQYPRYHEIFGGVCAAPIAYILTFVLSFSWSEKMIRRMGEIEWEVYRSVGKPAWKAIAWVLLSSYSASFEFSSDLRMGGGDRLALEIAPWVYLAGPAAAFLVGFLLSRVQTKRDPIATSLYVSIGYTASLWFISFVLTAIAAPYSVNPTVLTGTSWVPPLFFICLSTFLFNWMGAISEKKYRGHV